MTGSRCPTSGQPRAVVVERQRPGGLALGAVRVGVSPTRPATTPPSASWRSSTTALSRQPSTGNARMSGRARRRSAADAGREAAGEVLARGQAERPRGSIVKSLVMEHRRTDAPTVRRASGEAADAGVRRAGPAGVARESLTRRPTIGAHERPDPIYLDHAATTPPRPEVLDAMLPFQDDGVGQPGSAHAAGRRARAALDDAHERLAARLSAEPREIVFTSGGTEANNLAIKGAAWAGKGAATGS